MGDVSKMEEFVKELKDRFTKEYPDGSVDLHNLPLNPIQQMQGVSQYLVTMESPSQGIDRYLVSYHKESGQADFIRLFGG